jgi:DNA-binding CsgD family transcriptional regulator
VAETLDHLPGTVPAGLSAREAEVLEMASQGLTNLQIASRLNITVHAVKFHLAGVYRKLGVTNRTEAAVVYLTSSRRVPEPHSPSNTA